MRLLKILSSVYVLQFMIYFNVAIADDYIPIDLKNCTFGVNEISFSAFMGEEYDAGKVNSGETALTYAFADKISKIITEETGISPTSTSRKPKRTRDNWKNIPIWSGTLYQLKDGNRRTYDPVVAFKTGGKLKFTPNIKPNSSLTYLKALFVNELVAVKSNFGISVVELNLCGKYKAIVNTISENSSAEQRKENEELVYPIAIRLHMDSINEDKTRQPAKRTSTKLFDVGDSVYARFENGQKCKATVILPGKTQSKIEYNEWCETGFISSKSKGEKEWAPNHALSSR